MKKRRSNKHRQRLKSLPADSHILDSYDADYEVKDSDTDQCAEGDCDSHSLTFPFLQYPLLLIISVALSLDLFCYFLFRGIVYLFERISELFISTTSLKKSLIEAKSYKDWKEIADQLDDRLGLASYKSEPSGSFDEKLVKKITRKLIEHQDNIDKLMNTLSKSACKNDLGGIEAEELYSKCYLGTKNSINGYVRQLINSFAVVGRNETISAFEKASFFKLISRTYGRTALCLSGGAQLAWFHLGVIKALHDENLLPQIFTGTSAGSLIAAAVCVRRDNELSELFEKEVAHRITVCAESLSERIRNFYNSGAIFSDADFREKADWFTRGDITFLEAYQRTGRILNITVMSDSNHSKLKVLNYINSPDVTIRSASVASSSIPGIIPPCMLYMKDKDGKIVPYLSAGTLWRDGSMVSDIPEREIQQLFRVKHTIVSQVNPHIAMFFYKPKGGAGCPGFHRGGRGWRGGFVLTFLIRMFLLDIHKWLNLIKDTNLLPRIMGSNFSNLWLQSFEGNVTILPHSTISNLSRVLTDPNEEELEDFIRQGELRTWPKLLMISNQVRIEQAIGYWLEKAKEDLNDIEVSSAQ